MLNDAENHLPHGILVVDDEPLLRMVLVDLFEDAGYLVREASDAAEAMTILQSSPAIRIVVTDIQMPGSMDGLRLAGYINDAYPPIALIVCSGAVPPDQSALPGNAVFMPKPVNQSQLLHIIRTLAASR
jgi:CheY-like chemotaxis protein